jgi:hypothetical protein
MVGILTWLAFFSLCSATPRDTASLYSCMIQPVRDDGAGGSLRWKASAVLTPTSSCPLPPTPPPHCRNTGFSFPVAFQYPLPALLLRLPRPVAGARRSRLKK